MHHCALNFLSSRWMSFEVVVVVVVGVGVVALLCLQESGPELLDRNAAQRQAEKDRHLQNWVSMSKGFCHDNDSITCLYPRSGNLYFQPQCMWTLSWLSMLGHWWLTSKLLMPKTQILLQHKTRPINPSKGFLHFQCCQQLCCYSVT